jgi:hypothetical protein
MRERDKRVDGTWLFTDQVFWLRLFDEQKLVFLSRIHIAVLLIIRKIFVGPLVEILNKVEVICL